MAAPPLLSSGRVMRSPNLMVCRVVDTLCGCLAWDHPDRDSWRTYLSLVGSQPCWWWSSRARRLRQRYGSMLRCAGAPQRWERVAVRCCRAVPSCTHIQGWRAGEQPGGVGGYFREIALGIGFPFGEVSISLLLWLCPMCWEETVASTAG